MTDDEYSDAEQLARLRVALATGRLPEDLGRWALARLTEGRVTEVLRLRNQKLLDAADLIPGSRWRKARLIRAALAGHPAVPLPRRAARLVEEARQLDPDPPRSQRHFLRVLRA